MGHKNSDKIRSSNLELLRIFCIIAIIGDHFVGQSGIAQFHSHLSGMFYSVCVSLSRVACSVFIIISAWFLVDCPFKMKRIGHTWLTVIMYTVPITCLCKFFWHLDIPWMIFLQAFFPIESCPLWFAGYYIVLVMFSPVLNMILHSCSKKALEIMMLPLVIFMIFWSTVTAQLGFFAQDIWVLIFLYIFTGYLKLYPIHFFEKKKNCFLLFGIIEFLICFFKVISAVNLNGSFFGSVLSLYMEFYRARMQTLPNLAMAFCLFFGFKNIKMKNYIFINKMAGATLGIYCLHQVPCFYTFLWKNILKADYFTGSSYQYVYTISVILGVWLVGTVIELFRNAISARLIENRKWYNSFCKFIDDKVNIVYFN